MDSGRDNGRRPSTKKLLAMLEEYRRLNGKRFAELAGRLRRLVEQERQRRR